MSRTGRLVENASIIIIAAAVLLFGRPLIANLAHLGYASALGLLLVGVLQFGALRRNVAAGGPRAGIRSSRDVAFLAAIVFALVAVFVPARWVPGAAMAMLEFALILEVLARIAFPDTPQATSPAPAARMEP